MTAKLPRNPSGLIFKEWLRAAGWQALLDYFASDGAARGAYDCLEQLAGAWTNDADPAEWLGTAPKHTPLTFPRH